MRKVYFANFANKPFFMFLLNVIRQIFNCEKFSWAPVTLVLLCIIVVVVVVDQLVTIEP